MGLRIDERELLLHSGVGEQIATLLGQAIEQHKDTGRGASVVLAITVRTDAKTGKTHARGQVKATIPDGDNNMTVTKLPSQGLLTITNDHPGQQTLDDLADKKPAKKAKRQQKPKPERAIDPATIADEITMIEENWIAAKQVTNLPEIKCRIMVALHFYDRDGDCAMPRHVLQAHVGDTPLDVHPGQLVKQGFAHGDTQRGYTIDAKFAKALAEVFQQREDELRLRQAEAG
jgi:hypothetical protein